MLSANPFLFFVSLGPQKHTRISQLKSTQSDLGDGLKGGVGVDVDHLLIEGDRDGDRDGAAEVLVAAGDGLDDEAPGVVPLDAAESPWRSENPAFIMPNP